MTSKLLGKKNSIILLFEVLEVFYEAITWRPQLVCARTGAWDNDNHTVFH
jgi:hypothetical protein